MTDQGEDRMLKPIIQTLLVLYQRLSLAIIRRAAPSEIVAGIRVVDAMSIDAESDAAQRIGRALDLIRTRDPRRFNRIRRNIPEVVVNTVWGAAYDFHLGICFIGHEDVKQGAPEWVALLLVHESTHGELHRRGLELTAETHRRHEQICINEELRFARRLDGTEWVSRVTEQFSKITSLKQEQDIRLREIAASGMPKWYQRLAAYSLSVDETAP